MNCVLVAFATSSRPCMPISTIACGRFWFAAHFEFAAHLTRLFCLYLRLYSRSPKDIRNCCHAQLLGNRGYTVLHMYTKRSDTSTRKNDRKCINQRRIHTGSKLYMTQAPCLSDLDVQRSANSSESDDRMGLLGVYVLSLYT